MDAFVARVPCEVSRLAALRRDLGRWLAKTDLSDRIRSSVVLATHEAAANAIEHASPCESVEVRAAIDEESLTIAVRDTGMWKHANLDNGERGRGLIIINALIPRVEIVTEPSGTTVRMTAPLRDDISTQRRPPATAGRPQRNRSLRKLSA
jgi:anti-sigma regulatory factor (Ser/Thr protein kinase)